MHAYNYKALKMNPQLIHLNKKYLNEKLDYYHRLIQFSDEAFEEYSNSNFKHLTFTEWTQKQNKPPLGQCAIYFDKNKRDSCKLEIKNEEFYNIYNTKLENAMYRHSSMPLAFIIAQDYEFYLVTHKPNSEPYERKVLHSSLSTGEAIYGAGEIYLKDYRINSINNRSGHYTPGLDHFVYSLKLLKDKGANLDKATVTFYFKSKTDPNDADSRRFNSASNFLEVYSSGFDSLNYKNKIEFIDDAIEELSNETCDEAIYWVKEENDLVLFSRGKDLSNNEWDFVSFRKHYKKEINDISKYQSTSPHVQVKEESEAERNERAEAGLAALMMSLGAPPPQYSSPPPQYSSPPPMQQLPMQQLPMQQLPIQQTSRNKLSFKKLKLELSDESRESSPASVAVSFQMGDASMRSLRLSPPSSPVRSSPSQFPFAQLEVFRLSPVAAAAASSPPQFPFAQLEGFRLSPAAAAGTETAKTPSSSPDNKKLRLMPS